MSFTASLAKLNERIKSVESRIKKLESNLSPATNSDNQSDGDSVSVVRVKSDLLERNVFSYRLVRVPSDYYERNLNERATMLSCTTHQLCKRYVMRYL